MSIFYTDASHREMKIGLGIYNDTTGLGVVRVLEAQPHRDNATYGEVMAINEVLSSGQAVSHIYTDSRNAVAYWKGQKATPKYIYLEPMPEGCIIEWLPRLENVAADWLSGCPVDQVIQLPPGLGSLSRSQRPEGNRNSAEIEAKADARRKAYAEFLDSVSTESLREADEWLLAWLIQDAINKREFQLKLDEVRERHKDLAAKYRAVKMNLSKVEKLSNKRNS